MTTAAPTSYLAGLSAARRDALRAECARLSAFPDAEFGVRLLANTPTHETRTRALLHRWAEEANGFGAELARSSTGSGDRPVVVERTGGLDRLLMARYRSRPAHALELYTDTIALGEELVTFLGWRAWFPHGSLRAAAIAHEEAHWRLHDVTTRRALSHRLGHTVLSLGRLRIQGHVAGADEISAHAYAGATCGLDRTPLLLTAALMSAVQALGED